MGILTKENILVNIYAESIEDCLDVMLEKVIQSNLFLITKNNHNLKTELKKSFLEREKNVSTGIGLGVAIPHIYSENVSETVSVFASSKKGINFEAIDNSPVYFIFMLIAPQNQYYQHLKTLANIAKLLHDTKVRSSIQNAKSAEAIFDIINNKKPGLITN